MSEMYVIEKIVKKLNDKTEIEGIIYHDEDAEDPRVFHDNLGKMVCFHKKYTLGDKHDLKSSDFDSWDAIAEYLINEKKAVVLKTIFMYDHSGITISTSPYGDRWDSGQIGFIYVDEETMIKEYGVINSETKEKASNVLIGEIEEYDQFLRGDVYSFVVKQVSKCGECGQPIEETLDSCGGFYGIKYVKEELEGIMKGIVTRFIEQQKKTV